MKFHIVNTDNFGGDYPDESYAARDIPDKGLAQLMASGVNRAYGEDNSRFFKVVEDGYVLQPGFEP